MFGTIAPRVRALIANAAMRIGGGGSNQLLFQDANQNLASSSNMTWDGAKLTIGINDIQLQPGGSRQIYFLGGPGTVVGNGLWTASGVIVKNGYAIADAASKVPWIVKGFTSQSVPLQSFQCVSSTAALRDVGYVDCGFTVSTDASYTGFVRLCAQDFNAVTGGREGIRVTSSGTAAMVGFFGATPVVQQTGGVATAGATYTSAEQTMLQDVYNAVRAYGLMI